MKQCSKCAAVKPFDDFYPRNSTRDGLSGQCRACRSAGQSAWYRANHQAARRQQAEWRDANRDALRAQQAIYREKNQEQLRRKRQAAYASRDPEEWRARSRRNRLKANYGLTPGEYEAMAQAQGGMCAICGDRPTALPLSVDHDHSCCPDPKRSCGRCLRGLLCGPCNLRLGWFETHQERIQSYIKQRADSTCP